ncbi:hypothetical protein [Streptomyces sp. S1]|uniref:hypothetical protein n=1 Tax=Streptomyces sp. S1 TaxID=718288 RepID=UPI003D72E4C4
MNDHSDPSLRALFRAAADHGSREATTLPVAQVVARGRRAHRRRLALATATAGVTAVLGVATAATLAPGPAGPVPPATSPSVPLPGPSSTDLPGPPPRETEGATPPNPGSTTEGRRTYPPASPGGSASTPPDGSGTTPPGGSGTTTEPATTAPATATTTATTQG